MGLLDAGAHEFDTDLRKLLNTCLSFYIMIFDKENNDRGQSSSEQCLLCSFHNVKAKGIVGGLGVACPTLGNHIGPDQKERVVHWSKPCSFVLLHSVYAEKETGALQIYSQLNKHFLLRWHKLKLN